MTAIELEARWSARDSLYRSRRVWGSHKAHALTEEETAGIVAWRRREAEELPGSAERLKALTALSAWRPPIARQF